MMNKILSKLIFTVLAVLFTAEVMAQVPQGFNFQAVARDANGDLLIEQPLGVQVTVLSGSEEGSAVYTETQNPTTNASGSFQIVIGEGTSEDNFSAIDWSSDNFYVKLEIDPAGGNSYEELGTTRLLSVPYALLAQDVVNGTSVGELTTQFDLNSTEGDTSFIVNATGANGLTAIRGNASTEGSNRGIYGTANSEASNSNAMYGVTGTASGSGTGTQLGVFGSAFNEEATGGTRYGLYGQAGSQAKYNHGVRGIALGTGNGDEGTGFGQGSINFGVSGYAEGNTWNNSGIEANASGSSGKWNFGVHGLSSAGTGTTVENHGVAGRASGPGINYGIFGEAWDGAENWAGYFNGNVQVNGDLNVSGTVNETSDRNLKENIQPLQNGISTIMRLNPTTYNFRGNGDYNGLRLATGLKYGLIAQEVEEVLPSLVKDNVHTYTESVNSASGPDPTSENEVTKTMEYKSMNYTELVPILIKAVQEQQEVIEQLQKEVEKLKKK